MTASSGRPSLQRALLRAFALVALIAAPAVLPDAGAPAPSHTRPRRRPVHPVGEPIPGTAPTAGGIPNV